MNKLIKSLAAVTLALSLAACGSSSKDDKTIKVGATPSPHAEILNKVVKDELEKEGYTLEVTEFNDYVQPNTSVDAGDLDANYFQHINYLETFNEENGTKLAAVAGVHLEPMGVWSETLEDIKDVKDGATVIVPNDTTNEARALAILENAGLIELKKDVEFPLVKDITKNPKNLKFSEVEAANIPNNKEDADLIVVNGNYAIPAGLKLNKALLVEDANSEGAYQWINYIVVKQGEEESDKTKALVKAIQSDAVKTYIEETYTDGSVIAAFTSPEK